MDRTTELAHARARHKSPDVEEELYELRSETLRYTLFLASVAFAFWYLISVGIWVPRQTYSPSEIGRAYEVTAVALPVLAAGWALWKRQPIGPVVLVGGGLITVCWAIHVLRIHDPVVLYPILALIAAFVLHPLAGVTVTLLSALLVAWLQTVHPETIGSADALQVAIAGMISVTGVWILNRHLLLALSWYVDSYSQAESQMRDAREHRAQLVHAWTQLDVAYSQLARTNEELERARKAAEEARRLKAEFAANISHELRTPLNLIIGFSEMMVMNPEGKGGVPLAASYRGDVEAVYRNASHLSSLVDDILDLSKIDAHRMGLQREPTRIEVVVGEAVAAVGTMFRDKGLSLDVHLPPNLPLMLVDRTRLRQVVINLLNNAARFTSRGGVTIGGALDDREVVFWVTDTGTGIPSDDLPHVFDEFYQVGGGNWRRSTGLGLTISKQFVELHGGNMWIESRHGEGSTFYFSLPTTASVLSVPSQDEWQTWAQAREEELPPPAVAIVDDDLDVLKAFRRYLDGYEILTISEPREIRDLATTRQVQALIVSSDEARVEALKALATSSIAGSLPVITCPFRSSRAIGREMGVVRFLTKPVTSEQIRSLIAGEAHRSTDVLIVDDDPEMVRLLSRLVLMGDGGMPPQIRTAADGGEALLLMRQRVPDLVLLDLLMPGIDGYGVLDRMRADPRMSEVPVVLITAKGIDETMVASELSIARPGGLSLGEVMTCLEASLSALQGKADARNAPEPLGALGA